MRVLACDDEPLAAQRMTDLLALCEGVDLVGTAADGQEALDGIRALNPDLLLLDIEMPRFDGFDVIEELSRTGVDPPPLIIFVTAYPRFAAEAFETGALDFLTKPVRHARLEKALERARRALANREAERRFEELARTLEALRTEHRDPTEEPHVWVQRRGEMVRVKLAMVAWIAAEGEYIRLHLDDRSYLHRELLSAFMRQPGIDGDFIRIHRSFAVNRGRVASIRHVLGGGLRIVLDCGEELPVGRTWRKAVKAALVDRVSPG